ncbi:hypothetical protein EYF80_029599 [Liparis tanakae]|uniref:Uncharacterized protein n=1 Tax=Liparis tanakae TaxID=230148 RepID=A0A4Z2H2Z2_9TELE|nr:hypothetical protein EYF80_029599 [Liparis tanakae]
MGLHLHHHPPIRGCRSAAVGSPSLGLQPWWRRRETEREEKKEGTCGQWPESRGKGSEGPLESFYQASELSQLDPGDGTSVSLVSAQACGGEECSCSMFPLRKLSRALGEWLAG